jgi:hypothetical protein
MAALLPLLTCGEREPVPRVSHFGEFEGIEASTKVVTWERSHKRPADYAEFIIGPAHWAGLWPARWLSRTRPNNLESLKNRHDPTAVLLYGNGRVG